MAERPLSPHLQIYRPMLTMMMSIAHRITGGALYCGAVLLVAWLMAAATSEQRFNLVQDFFGHWFGALVLLGLAWALIHHTLGGIRHLVWDTGRGFGLKTIEWSAWATLGGSLGLTLLLVLVAIS